MNHTLNGHRYEFVYVDQIPGDELGLLSGMCDPHEYKQKKIYIRNGVDLPLLIDTLIHESLHGALWCLSEETVDTVATDISKVLIKELGITVQEEDS